MLRNKLSFILASSLCLAFAGCDDDDGGDTGAGATESGTTTDDPTTTTDTPATTDPTTDGETTDNPTTDGETTDTPDTDTSDDSSTTDDTSADPCDDVECDDGQSCLGGICVDDVGETEGGETEGGGDGDANYPNPAGGCPDGTVDGNDAVDPGINICIPTCDPDAADTQMACAQPETGTGIGACVLAQPPAKNAMACGEGTDIPAGAACPGAGEYCLSAADGSSTCVVAVGCLVLCGPNGELTCPDGMTCGGGVCSY